MMGVPSDILERQFGNSLQATVEPVDYFVRDLDGDDADDGLTQATAFKTFEPLARIAYEIAHLTIAHVGDHQTTGYAMPILGSHLYNHRLHIVGDGAGTGDGFTETLVPEASAAGTDETKVVTSTGGHTIDEFKGHTVIFTSGVCNGYRRMVHSNTATDLLFVTDTDQLGLSPSSGDTFRVVRPSVLLNMSEGVAAGIVHRVASGATAGFTTLSNDPGISGGLVFSQLQISATQNQFIRFIEVHTAFYGVESNNTSGVRVDWEFVNSVCFHGTNEAFGINASVATDLGAPDDAAWTGYGLFRVDTGSSSGGGPFVSKLQFSEFFSFIVSNKQLETRGNVTIHGGRVDEGLNVREENTSINVRANSRTSNPIRIFATGSNRAIRTRRPHTVVCSGLDLESVDGDMIEIDGGGYFFDKGALTGQATGTGLTVRVLGGGRYYVIGAPAIGDATALDFSVDGVSPVNKSFFTSAAVGIGNANTGSSISRDS